MQAQTQMSKGELLFEIQGKRVSQTVKEINPQGVRLQMNHEGQVTGKFNGGEISTLNVFLKPDGTSEWEAKTLQSSREGDMIVVSSRGTGSISTGSWHGDAVFMTQSPKLAWLNNTRGWFEGSTDMAQGTYKAKVYAKK